jgi:hypothetical protein
MSYDINGIRHVVLMPWGFTCPMVATRLYYHMTNPKHSVLLPDKPQAFCIITWQTPSLLYYYLTNPKPSLLLHDKPWAFCIITWQTTSLLYYYVTNPKPSVFLHDKSQAFFIITWQPPSILYYYLTNHNVIIQKAQGLSCNNTEDLGFVR